MKGDFTRSTFRKENHFHGVRMQQGRVQLDADWNEQIDIIAHREETENKDVVGCCGGPYHNAGFEVIPNGSDLDISAGRYYVNGILCENENNVLATNQPDLPENAKIVTLSDESVSMLPPENGRYLAYLDVWQWHITALEQPDIREKALGGPDTTTRTKSVWQVKFLRVGDIGSEVHCLTNLTTWNNLIQPSKGMIYAKTKEDDESDNPCTLAPRAGYQRLENQLYRVEIHEPGTRSTATFKWSRDNGSIVTKWESQDVANKNKLTVSSKGRDQILSFASGQWIELTDNSRELMQKRGVLVNLEKVEGNVLIIDPTTIIDPDDDTANSVDIANFPDNPKIRRWDSFGEIRTNKSAEIELEDGVVVKFKGGGNKYYKTGDYWLIPARTADADVEWPLDDSDEPEFQLPHGIKHYYCKLALLEYDGANWTKISDCRKIFPLVTELTSLFYISGDGQEAMPGDTLPKPLQVGVANGKWPIPGAKVKFKRITNRCTLLAGSSTELSGNAEERVVLTDENGMAEYKLKLNSNVVENSQQVEATLLDADDKPLHLPIRFTANPSVASIVHYDSSGCTNLQNDNNVQLAIEKLSKLTTIAHLGGDGQEAPPGEALPQLLKVSVTNKCGPIKDAKVLFTAEANGRVAKNFTQLATANSNNIVINSGPDGIAVCAWKLEDDVSKPSQELTAKLTDAGNNNQIQQPGFMRFTANLDLKSGGGGCSVTIGPNGQYRTLEEVFENLKGQKNISICLLPGEHKIISKIDVKDKDVVKITGHGSIIRMNAVSFSINAKEIYFRDFHLHATHRSGQIKLLSKQTYIENCYFFRIEKEAGPPLLLFNTQVEGTHSTSIYLKNNRFLVVWRQEMIENIKILTPIEQINKLEAVLKQITVLLAIDPIIDESKYHITFDETLKKIMSLDFDIRNGWAKNRPTEVINKLPESKDRNVINGFFDLVGKDTIDITNLRAAFFSAMKVIWNYGYCEALALSSGVGGWIENNDIKGYLTLHYSKDYKQLNWIDWSEDTLKKRRTFLNYSRQFINIDPVKLVLKDNNIHMVLSNGFSFMKAMKSILENGDWDMFRPQEGYEFMTITGNIFNSNGNSFVGQSLIISENTYANKVSSQINAAAYVLGYSGIFMGNVGASQGFTIETMLRPNWVKENANLLKIIY